MASYLMQAYKTPFIQITGVVVQVPLTEVLSLLLTLYGLETGRVDRKQRVGTEVQTDQRS